MKADHGMWRAFVERDRMSFNGTVSIWLAQRTPAGLTLMLPHDPVFRSDAEENVQHEPSLRLTGDVATALLDGLVEHFGGSSSVRRLEADLKQERGRVDGLIEHLAKATLR